METTSPAEPPRPPNRADFLTLCRALNAHRVKYLVVGGMAMIQQGYLRAADLEDYAVVRVADAIIVS